MTSPLEDERERYLAMRRRLADGEPLRLTVGTGPEAGMIVPAPRAEAELRARLIADLDRRIAGLDAALARTWPEVEGQE